MKDDPDRLSMPSNREEIKALKELVEDLKSRVHHLELRVLPPKNRNSWMGTLPRKTRSGTPLEG